MPKISVIVPVYNTEKYLSKCLDSLINQTLRDIEIICVDDKSTDNSRALLEDYEKRDNRIKLIKFSENKGQAVARNYAISIATGEYIAFIDPDDWVEHTAYEKLYNYAESLKSEIVFFAYSRIWENSGYKMLPSIFREVINFHEFRDYAVEQYKNIDKNLLLKTLFVSPCYSWNKIFSRKFLIENNIKFPDLRCYEDVEFIAESVLKANRISFLNEPLYTYLTNSNSTVQAHNDKKISLILDVYKQMCDYTRKIGFYKQLEKNLEYFIVMNIIWAFRKLSKKGKRQLIKNASPYLTKENIRFIKQELKITPSHRLKKFAKSVFSIHDASDRKYYLITVFGKKIKFLKLFDVYNEGNYKVFQLFFLKIKTDKYLPLRLIPHKIQKNKIVFSNYFGKSYGCNPKYITEEILRRNLPYELVWLVKNPKEERNNFPSKVRLAKYYSKQGLKELLTAKMWIDNTRKLFFWEHDLKKKPEQIYIQTWHGTLGMKKIEGSIKDENPHWRKYAKIDSENINFLLTTSKTDKKFMKESFWYDGKILVSGYPRNDVLYASDRDKQKIKEKVVSFLGVPKDNKFVLYCPTFRDDGRYSCFTMDYQRIISALEDKFNKKIILGTRFHPGNTKFANSLINYTNNLINATVYPDIMELLIAADVLITDYSSCIFDFMHLRKPAFIFATDIPQYEQERGFYFPLEDTPFSIATNNEELVNNIAHFNDQHYIATIDAYMKRNGYADDGRASERIVNLIEKVLRK